MIVAQDLAELVGLASRPWNQAFQFAINGGGVPQGILQTYVVNSRIHPRSALQTRGVPEICDPSPQPRIPVTRHPASRKVVLNYLHCILHGMAWITLSK